MVTKKDRRRNGYVTPKPTVPLKDLVGEDLFVDPFYDDWKDHRDGQRDWFSDFKKIKKVCIMRCKHMKEDFVLKRQRMNQKQIKLLKRRIARKYRIIG